MSDSVWEDFWETFFICDSKRFLSFSSFFTRSLMACLTIVDTVIPISLQISTILPCSSSVIFVETTRLTMVYYWLTLLIRTSLFDSIKQKFYWIKNNFFKKLNFWNSLKKSVLKLLTSRLKFVFWKSKKVNERFFQNYLYNLN